MLKPRYHRQVHQMPSQDWGLNQVCDWQLKFCWTPNRCALSGIDLWGRWAYRGIRLITGPGTPVEDVYWVDRDEFIMWRLKGVK
jgi:hypothetical protein